MPTARWLARSSAGCVFPSRSSSSSPSAWTKKRSEWPRSRLFAPHARSSVPSRRQLPPPPWSLLLRPRPPLKRPAPKTYSKGTGKLWLTKPARQAHQALPGPRVLGLAAPGAARPAGGPVAPGAGGGRSSGRKKVCKFCVEKIDAIHYRDVRLLQQFVAERGKIVPRRLTGVCTTHQRGLARAIKQARNIALLPFAARY